MSVLPFLEVHWLYPVYMPEIFALKQDLKSTAYLAFHPGASLSKRRSPEMERVSDGKLDTVIAPAWDKEKQ
jgi:hypothetical protein